MTHSCDGMFKDLRNPPKKYSCPVCGRRWKLDRVTAPYTYTDGKGYECGTSGDVVYERCNFFGMGTGSFTQMSFFKYPDERK